MRKRKLKVRHSKNKLEHERDPEHDFHTPDGCCPDRLPSPKIPSPTDCLPPGELEKLHEKITAANELLLDLALGDERPPEETFQKIFDGLLGQRVKINGLSGEMLEGKVTLSGFSFVVLRDEETITIYPYSQIETIEPLGRYAEHFDDPELVDIEPCFRRELTFHFGNVVSSSPELIHLFFRMRLDIYLLLFEDRPLQVSFEGTTMNGILTDVNKDSIVLDVDGSMNHIPLETISLITGKA